eukprot:13710904-Alexandrium_andersonii.AAC.1
MSAGGFCWLQHALGAPVQAPRGPGSLGSRGGLWVARCWPSHLEAAEMTHRTKYIKCANSRLYPYTSILVQFVRGTTELVRPETACCK